MRGRLPGTEFDAISVRVDKKVLQRPVEKGAAASWLGTASDIMDRAMSQIDEDLTR